MNGDVYICEAVRTPVGRAGGGLARIRPDDLAAAAVRAVVARCGALDPADIDDVWFGDANGAGEDNRDVARMAVLLAGLPPSVPGATVNRLCGSGMEAVIEASRAVLVGDADIVVAGGVESMSRAPWVVLKPERAFPTGHEQLWSTTLGWRMVNPRMPAEWTISLGEGAEVLADKYGITRGGTGRVRAPLAPARRGGLGRRCLRRRGRGRARRRPQPRRGGTSRLVARGAGQAATGVPARRHGDRGQRIAAQRWRRRARAGFDRWAGARRAVAHGPRREPGHRRRGASALWDRARRRGSRRARDVPG